MKKEQSAREQKGRGGIRFGGSGGSGQSLVGQSLILSKSGAGQAWLQRPVLHGHSTAGAALCPSGVSQAGQRPQGLLTSTGTGSVSMSAWLANRPALSTSAFRWG